jgi:cbb3-type cytochrome oxidase subunit 3
MVDPLVGSVASFALVLVPVLIARSAHPRTPRRRHGIDHAAMAQIEENDIEQMLDGLAERRRRNGKRSIADELSDEALRSTWR